MRKFRDFTWVIVFSASSAGFALSSHRGELFFPKLAFLGVCGASLLMSLISVDSPERVIFGKPRLLGQWWRISVMAFLGFIAAMGYRMLLTESPLPSELHWFAVPAMLVGVTEELLWRGWMQGILTRHVGASRAVLLAAVSHTAYKASLFALPSVGSPRQSLSMLLLAGLTFVFGVLLGVFRARQGTIAGPVVFHALFDLLVYGELSTSPWWFW
jgi:membrane protease YdiL (CAAX protease family)